MTKYLSLLFLVFLCYISANAAPGDDCSTAIAVSSNGCSATTAYDNTGITGTLVAPSCFTTGNNNGMWFQFVATTKIVNITVNGSTLTQPQVALLQPPTTGCTGTFTELVCNSSGTTTATLNYSNLTIGNIYYIYIDGRNNLVGTFQLCLTSPIAPTNDDPCTPIIIPAANYCSGTNEYTNVGASTENLLSTTIPGCWTNTGAFNTVYFQFTALGIYNTITVSGNLNSPQIAIISTANCNGSAYTSTNCASSNTNTVTMNANNLTPGQTYLIAVDGKIDNVGAFQLCLNSFTPSLVPTNDKCTGAISLCNGYMSGSTKRATNTSDIPLSQWNCNGVLDNPVWYKFVAATPVQNVVFNLSGLCAGGAVQLEVFKYTGAVGSDNCLNSNISKYTSIASTPGCNYLTGTAGAVEIITVPAASMVAGQTYYVLIDNYPSDSCDFSFVVTGIGTTDAGADKDVCYSAAPFNLVGTPTGGTWTGAGITNSATGTFDPKIAGFGSHTLFYKSGLCTDDIIVNVTGPQVVCSNDVSICGGSTQITGSVNEYPTYSLKQFSNNTSVGIPDNNTTGVSSVINVSGISPSTVATNPIQKVCLNINHSWDSDLDIFLNCPGGTQIELSTDNGSTDDNYTNTCFVATGTSITSGSAPFIGNFTPEQPFTNLNSCNINGAWTLIVKDDAGGDVGTLLNWSIYFNQQNAINYTWSPTTNMTNSTTLNPTVSPTTNTTYYLTATDNNSCTAKDSVRVSIGGSIAGPDQSICLTKSTTFASSGTGIWTPLASNPAIVSIQSNTNPTSSVGPFNTAGVYNFEWNAGGCKDTVKITVNTPPIANAGLDKTINCTTTSVQIGTAAVAGVTYSWSPTNGLSNPNIAQPTASQAGTFTVTATNSTTGCFSTDAVTVTQTAILPTADAGLDKILTCSTTSVQIGTTATAGITYSWSPTNGLSNPNIAQPTASQAGTFTVTATNTSNGCTASDAVTITQNITPPTANAGLDAILTCSTTSVTIGTTAIAGTTYSWSPSNGLSNPNIAQPTASQTGTFTVTATNTSNGCTATDAVNITQNITAPNANAGLDKTLNCTTTSVQIGTAAVAGVTYVWSPANGLSNPNIAQPTASQTGTFTVTATNTSNGCTATDAVTITQNITAPIANAGLDKTLNCTTTSVQIGTAAVAGVTYVWSPTNGLSNPNIAQPIASQAGTFTVTATNTSNGCTASDAVTITQNITPPTANAGLDAILTCSTTSVTIGTTAIAGTTYSWSPTNGLSNPNIAQPTASQTGTFTVTATNTNNGCTATDAVTITQNITAPIANAGLDKTLNCTTTSVQIGTAAVAGVTYVWSPTNGLSNPNIAQPTASQAGTFTLTATNTSNGCTATDAVTITQSAVPPTADAGLDKILTCSTTSVQIGTTATAGITYSWSPTNGLSNPNIAQPTASQAGTFTVTATNTSNGCTASDAVTITQNITPPTANAGLDKTLTCTTPSLTIGTTAIAGTTYSWSPTNGLSNPNIAQPTASQTGTFTVTATNTSNGCTATDAVTITRSGAFPTANAGSDKTLTCSVTSVSIGMSPVAGITYSWSPTNGLSNPNISQPTASQPGTFTLTATDPLNGCISTDDVVISQNNTAPSVDAGIDKELTCATTSVLIGTSAIAGITYTWSPTNGISNPNIAQPTASQAGTFTVTATNTSNGCTASDAVTITQNITAPIANAGLDKTLTCSTPSITIGTTAIAGTTYSWSPTNGLSNPNIAQPTASQTGTFTVTATNTSNGCTATDAVTITQNITTPIANAGLDKTLNCTTTSVQIGTTAIAGVTYVWSPTNGLSNPNIAQPTASQAGTFTVTATNTSNGCTATDAVNISQNIISPVANAGIDKTLTCTTTSIQIGTPAIAGITYVWSPINGLSNPNIAQPTASQPGTFIVTATNIINGCTDLDTVIISQNITAPVANAGSLKTLTCTTTSVQIGGNVGVAGINYTWFPTNGISNPNNAQTSATQPGSFTLTATNPANGCTSNSNVSILQDITPPISDAGIDKTITCTAISVNIGTPAILNTSYTWNPSIGLSSINIAQPNAIKNGIYTVTATNNINGCTASNSVIVSIDTLKPIANAGIDKLLTCATTSVSIGSNAISGINYSWSPSSGLNFGSITSKPDAILPNTYTLTALNPSNGCVNTDMVIVSQNTSKPAVDAGIDKTLTCTTNFVTIGTPAIANFKYTWTPTIGLNVNNIAQPTASDSGTYIVTALDPSNGCTSTDTVDVILNRPFTDLELGPDQTIYQEESATITASGAITSGSIIWTPTATLSCGNCITTIASPITTTSYFVSYKNPDECVTLDTITVNVIPIVGLFFPSAFSPNGDGINDEFAALGDSVKTYELNIYNRWGELLYTTNDRYASWNGKYNGIDQPLDSYVYTAHATLINNKKKDYHGTFSLIK